MNYRDLDRWITGNGGEDQYLDADNCWECPLCGLVYWPPTKSCSKCCRTINEHVNLVDGCSRCLGNGEPNDSACIRCLAIEMDKVNKDANT